MGIRFLPLFVAVACAGVLAASAAELPQIRHHLTASDEQGRIAFTVTDLAILTETADEHVLLIRDEELGEMWVLDRCMAYADHRSSYEIRDVKGNPFLSLTYPLTNSGRTRAEFIAERKSSPALGDTADPLLTIEAPGVSRTAKEAEWQQHQNLRAWRSQIRRAMNPSALDAIERMRPMASALPISTFYDVLFRRILYGKLADFRSASTRD